MRKISKRHAEYLIKELDTYDDLPYSVIEINGTYYQVRDTDEDSQAAFALLKDKCSQPKVSNK